MIVPVVFPSAGEFWLKNNPEFFINYTFSNRRLCSLPEHYEFAVSSQAAAEVAGLLNVATPLYVTSPGNNFKRYGPACVILSHPAPFPPDSFVLIKHGIYDIYVASPELCFLQAARTLDLIDLVKFGYDLCALYIETNARKLGQVDRTSFTFVHLIREYLEANHHMHSAVKARKALRYVRDFSNSPMETKLAIFASLPARLGGCGLSRLELNKAIALTDEGKYITGCPQIRGDLVFYDRVVVEYNSNMVHLTPRKYTDDMNRQTALKLAGYKYIGVTYGNIQNYHSMINMMNVIRRYLYLPPLDEDNPARTALYFRLFE